MVSTAAIAELCLFFPVFLLSLCVHEWAHAWVANKLGDPTPKYGGRLTLNPIAHIDPVGTIFFPIMVGLFHIPLFGWAKPVPVDERNFRNPRRYMAFVAAAGPVSNVILAIICAAFGGILSGWIEKAAIASSGGYNSYALTLLQMLQRGIGINLFLALFNLIPLGPLDGAKVLHLVVPARQAQQVDKLQQYGGMILMMLLLLDWILPSTNLLGFMARPVIWGATQLYHLFQF